MTAPRPLSLTDYQLRLLRNAARAVPVEQRDRFLTSVAAHLTATPTDAALMAALNAQLDALPHYFMCDSKPAGLDDGH